MTLDELIAGATARIHRYLPAEAQAAAEHGAALVDIRSGESRRRFGVIPGAVHVPRTVLEWRVASEQWCNPALVGERLILVCDQGYSSALAAATLVNLGRDCGDVVGGFDAWLAAGLPVAEAPEDEDTGLPGMGQPD
ncbi:MAG: rhodanese-like domain-containing protein [Gaiellaceae bacterium]